MSSRKYFVHQSAELENTMTAVERVVEYETVDPEDELEATGERKPPKEWPQEGAIIFDKLSMRYFPDPTADLVLKDLDFDILPMEKVRFSLKLILMYYLISLLVSMEN